MDNHSLPRHVAIIMDGNGRWAKRRLLPRSAGHRAGFHRMLDLADHVFSCGVRCLTLFALSTENLQRPKEELEGLFGLFREFFPTHSERLKKQGIALKVIGDLMLLPEDIRGLIADGVARTADGSEGTLVFAMGYGSRQEIVAAAKRLSEEGKEITEENFSACLMTDGLPPLDLLIRTGNEMRLSNFLLYQAAYAELYFSEKMFPDFSDGDFDEALKAYSLRDRRFGRV